MADFTALKTAIQQYIAQNGNKEITGNLLQTILLAMVQSMGDQAINGVLQMLSNEMIARENADGSLSQALTAEQQRAIAAETKSAVLDGETKTLVFKNAAGQELYQVSVASLISNGLVDVELDGTNLVMTFHTESGDKEITIPIGDIFNPSNYYTKTQVDGLLLPLSRAITRINDTLHEGALYVGYATPETIPTEHEGASLFYIATEAGEYTHFFSNGDIPVVIPTPGLHLIVGGIEADDWHWETIVTFTNNVQFNSSRLITSGGVFNAINPINELLHRNYILAGVADTTTIPTEDTNVFYLAGQGGTYTHFLNGSDVPLVLPKGFTVIYRGVEDDGWNYWTVYADNDFINTNRSQDLSSAQKSLARTNMDVYSKSEVNSLITTPEQGYISVTATDQTTSVTDVLPVTGAADTIYRVGCWDGTQYDVTVYSEYAWNGTQYIKLTTKEVGIDDEPTLGSDNLVKSGGIANMYGSYIENPEWAYVVCDSEDKTLEGIKTDGTKVIFGDLEVGGNTTILGKIDIQGATYTLQENPEWIKVLTDAQDIIIAGVRKDGSVYIGQLEGLDDKLQGMLTQMQQMLDEAEQEIDAKIAVFNSVFSIVDNPEFIQVTTDSEGKVISYRDMDGVKHEEVGVETSNLKLTDGGIKNLKTQLDEIPVDKNWYLPKFGKVNIKEETFYLTADPRWSTKNDVVCIQMLDDTYQNAADRKTLSYYYIKSTLTPLAGGGYDRTSVNENSVQLQLFPGKDIAESNGKYFVKKITKVNGEYYLTSSLKKTDSGYDINYIYGQANSMKVNYTDENPDQTTLTNAIEVGKITDIPPYKAWFVSKELEHYCIADIDFGSFYKKNNVAVGIKYQGSGSTQAQKRGLRLTFYKNATYAKKDKIKIGEMVRLSGYNMKSYAYDTTLVKDPVVSNLLREIWESRGKECYPWNKDNCTYNGATGFIKSFPIQTWFGNEFFGLQFFGLKKDERNYMLDGDDDSSGIFVSGANDSITKCFENANHSDFEDEMMDDMSQETADAIDEFCKYTKGFVDGTIEIDGQVVDFTNDMLEERIDIDNWIDYWIGLELFMLWDNAFHNVIMYSGRDKKKFYLFYYDLDHVLDRGAYDSSYIEYMNSTSIDIGFWEKFTAEYKDYIINRYAQLRKSVLTIENIKSIYISYVGGIEETIIQDEKNRWGGDPIFGFENVITYIESRLAYLDNHYFNL